MGVQVFVLFLANLITVGGHLEKGVLLTQEQFKVAQVVGLQCLELPGGVCR